jgi:hypothetical protein
MKLTQLEWFNLELKWESYEFLKFHCICYKINKEINFVIVFMSKQRHYVINNILQNYRN